MHNLLNEYKGNIFEFIIASEIAKKISAEAFFLENLPTVYLENLSKYEQEMNKISKDLGLLMKDYAKSLIEKLDLTGIVKLKLVGKLSNSEEHEGDIVLIKKDNGQIPLSIKLCKKNAFVNTKSAGVRTFFSKYFDLSEEIQIRLNNIVDTEFYTMANCLYESLDLEFKGDFNNWPYSHLPGELEKEQHKIVMNYYSKIIHFIYDKFVTFDDNLNLKKSLFRLAGFGSDNLIQAIFLYGDTNKIIITDNKFYNDSFEQFKIIPIKENISSFEIKTKNFTMQIRVKPMNKFTVPALKVNCSIKY